MLWCSFLKKVFNNFHGTGLKILEIHAVMALRVGNISFLEANIFFLSKKLHLTQEF